MTAAGLEAVLVGCRLGRQSTTRVRNGDRGMLLIDGPGFEVSGCPAVCLEEAGRMRGRLPP